MAIVLPALYFLMFRPWNLNVAELEKSKEEARLAYNVLESSSEPVLITDAQANIEYVNPAFCTITGYAKEEVIGKNPRQGFYFSVPLPAESFKELVLSGRRLVV